MFRRDLQLTAHMILAKRFEIFVGFLADKQVISQAALDKKMLHFRNRHDFFPKLHGLGITKLQVVAFRRHHTLFVLACP